MNRRDFLASTSLFLGSPLLNRALAEQNSEKAVILIHMQGGISAVDFINPLPEGTSEYKSSRGYTMTKSGFDIGADFKELAKLSDDYSIVRGLKGRDANHESATYEWMTSHKHVPNVGQKEPSYGSIFLRKHGTVTREGVPYYVKLRQVGGDDAAWMGIRYAGVDADAQMVSNMTLSIPDQQFERRLSVLKGVDSTRNLEHLGQGWTEVKDQAVGIIKGTASQAFKTDNEPENIKAAYGTSRFGKDLLLARRLVEHGARVVTLNSNAGWDNHSGIDAAFQNNAPGFDIPMSVFITDLKERGMLDNVMIVTVSEFSRTKMNINAGRDHWPSTNSSMIIGGGYNHGRVIGSTDKTGLQVVDGNYEPKDLAWTILDHLGIEKKYTVMDPVNRPRHLISDDARNILT